MFVKLFVMYPAQPDVEMRLSVCMEALEGVPWRLVSQALQDIVTDEKRDQKWCPTVPEILAAVARRVRRYRQLHDGEYVAQIARGGRPADKRELEWLESNPGPWLAGDVAGEIEAGE